MNAINSSDHVPDKPNEAPGDQEPTVDGQHPASTLNLYRRLPFGRKHLFGHDNADQAADYFVVNRVPQKHSSSWRPVFYRGDNPKYADPDAGSTSMWNSFEIQIGDGVGGVLENKARAKKRKQHERRQKTRRFFCRPEKSPPEPIEDPTEVQGLVAVFKMRRSGFLKRKLEWELGGQQYRWKGTRRFLTGPLRNRKGVSHDFKVLM
jgi:hypothetical protein